MSPASFLSPLHAPAKKIKDIEYIRKPKLGQVVTLQLQTGRQVTGFW